MIPEYDIGVPMKSRAPRKLGMTAIVREMPFGASKLFETREESIRCCNIMRQCGYVSARRKRTLEQDGEEGWRVWKMDVR